MREGFAVVAVVAVVVVAVVVFCAPAVVAFAFVPVPRFEVVTRTLLPALSWLVAAALRLRLWLLHSRKWKDWMVCRC